MKLEKKHKIAIGISAGFVILSAIGLLIARSKKLLFWKEDDVFVANPEVEQQANEQAVKTGKPRITWRNDSFPLSVGSKGQNVKNLQKYLGIDDDGYFGYDTLDALKKKNGKDRVMNEAEYTPKTTTQTTTQPQPFAKGQKVYAKSTKAFIYYNPDNAYLLGYREPFKLVGNFVSLTTVPGWSKVYVTGYYEADEDWTAKAGNYFIKTTQLTDKET